MGEARRKLEEKQKAFKEDPNRFVDKADIVFAAILQDGTEGQSGLGYLCNDGIPDHTFKVTLYDIGQTVDMLLMRRKALREAERIKNDKRIIAPDGH